MEPFNFSFFGISGWGIDLDYCDIESFALERNRDYSVIFEIVPNTAFHTLLLTIRSTPFLLRGLEGKAFACNAGDPGSIPVSERCPREGNGNPLQYSCLRNPMDGGAW